ncbi:hypothetical protein D3C78_1677890 [compost metagenome]
MLLSALDDRVKGLQLQLQALTNPKERLPLLASAAVLQVNPEWRIPAREKLGIANSPSQLIGMMNSQMIQQFKTDRVVKMQHTRKRQTG